MAASNLLDGNHRTVAYPPISSVVFTLPPLASVGLQEAHAKDKELRFRVNATDHILGVHLMETGSGDSRRAVLAGAALLLG